MFNADYKKRRQALQTKLQGGIIIFPGNNEAPCNYPDNAYKFRQDSSFLYFFGINRPGMTGVIDLDSSEEYLFGDDVTMDDIIWMGPQPSVKDMAASIGVDNSGSTQDLKTLVTTAARQRRQIHYLPPYRHDTMFALEEMLGIPAAELKAKASLPLIKAVVDLRSVKEPCEIEEIERACDIGYEMHTTAMRLCKPGVKEQYIAGVLDGIAAYYGSMTSYATILSQNGETLHTHYHGNILQTGKLMLTDAGAETVNNYCSDFTRTVPVGGRFTCRQKDVYNIVVA